MTDVAAATMSVNVTPCRRRSGANTSEQSLGGKSSCPPRLAVASSGCFPLPFREAPKGVVGGRPVGLSLGEGVQQAPLSRDFRGPRVGPWRRARTVCLPFDPGYAPGGRKLPLDIFHVKGTKKNRVIQVNSAQCWTHFIFQSLNSEFYLGETDFFFQCLGPEPGLQGG